MARRAADDLGPLGRQRWAAARLWAAHQAPYLASALLALEAVVVAKPSPPLDLSTFPADVDWHVYVDPAVLDDTPPEVIGFWLIHQTSHLLRHHHERFPITVATPWPVGFSAQRDPEQVRWNIAGDLEINDDLVAGEVAIPDDAQVPSRHGFRDGYTAETYFDMLPDHAHDRR